MKENKEVYKPLLKASLAVLAIGGTIVLTGAIGNCVFYAKSKNDLENFMNTQEYHKIIEKEINNINEQYENGEIVQEDYNQNIERVTSQDYAKALLKETVTQYSLSYINNSIKALNYLNTFYAGMLVGLASTVMYGVYVKANLRNEDEKCDEDNTLDEQNIEQE